MKQGPRHNIDLAGTAALLGTLFCWSAIPVFLRGLTQYVDPWTANAIRYPFAAILFWPILLSAWHRGRIDATIWVRALVPAFFSAAGQILWAMAPYYLEASLIGFLIKTAMLWGTIAALIIFPEERVLLTRRKFLVGFALALVGCIALAWTQGSLDASSTRKGIVVILICGVFFGLYGVSVRYFLGSTRPPVAFGVVAQYVSIVTVVLFFLRGSLLPIPGGEGAPGPVLDVLARIPAHAWRLLLISSFLGIGISHVLFYTALQRIGAAISSSSHLTTPFLTLALAFVFLGESMTLTQCLWGSVMIAGGASIVLAQQKIVNPRARTKTGE